MTDMNKIAEKIQNLLNKTVGNGASEAEAKSALLMAQKLMAKYNIELSQLSSDKELKYSLEHTIVKPNPRNNRLGNIIADSFAVKGILYNGRWCFFGREADAKAAASALTYVYRVLEAGIRNICREHGLKSSERGAAEYYNPYSLGFISGLSKAMAEQTKALCIVTPEDVKQKFGEKFPNTVKYRAKDMQYSDFNFDAYAKGHEDGKSAMDKRSLEA